MGKTIILDNRQIEDRLKRIAYQIYESNVDETTVVIAGIDKNGYKLAEKLSRYLKDISPINVALCKVVIDKRNPFNEIKLSLEESQYKNKSIILVDDVLNSGRTLMYGVKHFLDVPIKLFKTAVLVDRNHKKFPIKADYKGISLSTSLNEHVEIDLSDKTMSAYLV